MSVFAVFPTGAPGLAAVGIYRDVDTATWWTREDRAGKYEVLELPSQASFQEGYLAGWRAALDVVRATSRGVTIDDLTKPAVQEESK